MEATTSKQSAAVGEAGAAPASGAEAPPIHPHFRALPPELHAGVWRAERGDAAAMAGLGGALDRCPQAWSDAYVLNEMAEAGWLRMICGLNLVARETIRRHLGRLKAEWAGPSPTPLEKLLAERLAVCWLAAYVAERAEMDADAVGLKVAQHRLKRLDSAHRRLLSAAKALAAVRRLQNGLRIEINHVHAAPVAPAAPHGPAAAAAAAADTTGGKSNGRADGGADGSDDTRGDEMIAGGRLREVLAGATAAERVLAASP